MRAIEFHVGAPRYLLARSLGRVSESATFGFLSGLRLRERPAPEAPGPGWARLRVLGCGICGSDIGNLTYASSPIMEPFGSFPAVLGHEILAEVESVGSEVTRVEPGQRVAVDPMLSCDVRGFTSDKRCRSCRQGRHGTCEMAGEEGALRIGSGHLSRGLTIGYHRDLPGGWGERMIAHEAQLFPLDPRIPSRLGVLVEPLSIGVHAVLNAPPDSREDILVIGSGPIAFGTIWALRSTGFDGSIVAQMKRPHEARLAHALGATEVVAPGDEARAALIETGAQAYQPIVGPEVYSAGGFSRVYDCVGSVSSLDQALRYSAPRGTVTLLGCAGELRKLDLSLVWARELKIRGFVVYGREQWSGRDLHTMEVTQELLLATRAPLEEMVTHVFPLAEYRHALSAARNHRKSGAIRVVLTPTSAGLP